LAAAKSAGHEASVLAGDILDAVPEVLRNLQQSTRGGPRQGN
jgi:hypothetical protein